MTIPEEYSRIRPFLPEELPEVFERLAQNAQFRAVLAHLYPDVPVSAITSRMKKCPDSLSFQRAFCYPFLNNLAARGIEMDAADIDLNRRYTFISNHRDIVLDSAFLCKLLFDADCATTCEIAIGDNLLSLPWVRDLVRVNKAFIVERSLPGRQFLQASRRLASYMHYAIDVKEENVWIAQREGRAKDSNDRTQEALLKMMAMAGEGTPAERLRQLHLVPLAISYEYDPCDFLKAAEMQQRRDQPDWHKAPGDDVRSMQTGIMGFKGHVHYHCAPCLDAYLAALPPRMTKTEFFATVAAHIDAEIHKNYRLYPGNYAALDILQGSDAHAQHYTADARRDFEAYIQSRVQLVQIPNKDYNFLRQQLLTQYAYPAANQLGVKL